MIISRLTAVAATFAVLATASLAFAAETRPDASTVRPAAGSLRVVQLERVVIVAKRLPTAAH